MKKIVGAFLFPWLLSFPAPHAGAQMTKLNLAYTATSPYQAVLIITKEAGFFRKNNLDVSLIFTAGGSLGLQAMMGGDVAMVVADGSTAGASSPAGAGVPVTPR